MIQEAHIGIGIQGREGGQAALASDYVIGQFRFLEKLILVHGHWSYYRTSYMVLAFLSKSWIWALTSFWLQAESSLQVVVLYEYFFIVFFNLLFTALPPFSLGIFDQNLSQTVIEKFPQIYKIGIKQHFSTAKVFAVFFAESIYCSVAAYFIFGHDYVLYDGQSIPQSYLGTTTATGVIIFINLHIGFLMHRWTILSGAAFYITAIGTVLLLIILNFFPEGYGLFMLPLIMVKDCVFWLSLMLFLVVGLLPRVAWRTWCIIVSPSDHDILLEGQHVETKKSAVSPII